LRWDDRDGSSAAGAWPGDDFTAMAFIIQHYFMARGLGAGKRGPGKENRAIL
jgi:hypothetical protein